MSATSVKTARQRFAEDSERERRERRRGYVLEELRDLRRWAIHDLLSISIGRDIRRARNAAGLRQADLAVVLGCTETEISDLESGESGQVLESGEFGIVLWKLELLLRTLNLAPEDVLPRTRHDPGKVPSLVTLPAEDRAYVLRELERDNTEGKESTHDRRRTPAVAAASRTADGIEETM